MTRSQEATLIRRVRQTHGKPCGKVNNYQTNAYQCVLSDDGEVYCDEGYLSPADQWYPNNLVCIADVSDLPFDIPLRFDIVNETVIVIPTSGFPRSHERLKL